MAQGTLLAKNQKLLVKLSDSVKGLPDNQRIKRAREFIELVRRGAVALPMGKAVVEPPSGLAVVHCAGIPLSMQFDGGQLRIRDLDVAALLLLQKPRNTRAFIKSNLEFLEGHRVRPLSVPTQMTTNGVR